MNKNLLLILVLSVLGFQSLMAQAPANDACADAAAVMLDMEVSFSTLEATTDGPPSACFTIGTDTIHQDLWYTFTPAEDALIRFSVCGTADFDTRIAVYNPGSDCAALSDTDLIDCNDDGTNCANFTSELDFEVVAGSTYLLRLGGYGSTTGTISSGSGTFTLSTVDTSAPENDFCADAIVIELDSAYSFSTLTATDDGPTTACYPNGTDSIHFDIWYSYTATFDGMVRWSNCNTADFDSRVGVYGPNADCATLSDADLIACNDDGADCTAFTSELFFDVISGNTYLLRMGGFGSVGGDGASGTGTVILEEFIPAPTPDNNDCAGAIPVTIGTGQEFNTSDATTTGPDHPDNEGACFGFGSITADNDIYYTFTPDFTGSVQWSTCGTINFDSRLVVYGPNVTCPVTTADFYACNDDGAGCPAFSSSLIFDVVADSTYLLRLGGFGGDSGVGTFDLIEVTPPEPPVNDLCADAIPVGIIEREAADNFDELFEGTTLNGTFDSGDFDFPVCLGNQNGGEFAEVWYSFNTLGNTTLEFRLNAVTEGAQFFLDIYEACGTLADTSLIESICMFVTEDAPFAIDTFGIFPDVPTDYLIRVSTRLTSDVPGEFWFQIVGDIISSAEEEPDFESFSYFPNPVGKQLTTQFGLKESANVQFEVHNVMGQLMQQERATNLGQGIHSKQINVTDLPAGVYFLSIVVDDKRKNVRFVKR